MGNLEVGRFENGPVGKQDVDVEGTGTVARSRPPAHFRLDRFRQAEEFPRRKDGLHGDDLVRKPGLIDPADGLRPVDRRLFFNPNAPAFERSGRSDKVLGRISEVASQAQIVAPLFRKRRARTF
jgi:hypothetical protein